MKNASLDHLLIIQLRIDPRSHCTNTGVHTRIAVLSAAIAPRGQSNEHAVRDQGTSSVSETGVELTSEGSRTEHSTCHISTQRRVDICTLL